ncbi:hypothetical protein [Acetobacter okinawensis]|uniref:hypothetical protein n=1 Tax=Acetobacter okinawensis TaxID=1076594 RepID=UPI00209D9D1A|nr:hypothetical protein [Acetobacter okinawensis]MCP1213981.1 hypothetical protein [Acetobacter okinawensis]
MTPIIRGEGLTPSEQRLARFADRAFLRLWSYPNTFNDRTKTACGGGQELADLLAVFENHVVLFSDKAIRWQEGKAIELAWSRWYRRAVNDAVVQLNGAERWLDLHPDRVFTDKHCTQPLPVPLPGKADRITHLVAVVSGAEAACRRYFSDPRGSLIIVPGLKGDAHVDITRSDFRPFLVGDVNPGGTFIHVFDPVGLEFVMSELDTVADLTAYLTARTKFLRSGKINLAAGEEHLLAAYMMNGFKDGKPGFIPEKLRKRTRRAQLVIPEGEYETYVSSQLYAEIAGLKKQSMLWDEVIELVTQHVLDGTSISILNYEPSVALSEEALRVIAAEPRMNRVSLAHALWGAMTRCVTEGMARFVRRTSVTRRFPMHHVGYLFLILPQDKGAGSYEEYRVYRSRMLLTYCLSLFREQPKLDTVVGMAFDVYLKDGEIRTRSEDVLALEPPDWTPEEIANLQANRALFEMVDLRELKTTTISRRIRNPFRASMRSP